MIRTIIMIIIIIMIRIRIRIRRRRVVMFNNSECLTSREPTCETYQSMTVALLESVMVAASLTEADLT